MTIHYDLRHPTPASGQVRRSVSGLRGLKGVLAATAALWLSFHAPQALADDTCAKPFELSNSGRYLVDACQNRFKLKSVNWYGGSDTWQVPLGLDKQSIAYIANLIRQMGFNSVRLPFSNQAIHTTTPVNPAYVSANPELVGKTPLQVYDAVVQGLTDAGVVVVLNNHTTSSEWCCNYDKNGLWWGGSGYWQSTEQWRADWVFMANRYKGNGKVAAADLRNEVRTMLGSSSLDPISPKWADHGGNDWRQAATDAGNEILKANPKMLVIVEGINYTGVPLLGGYRPLLSPAYDSPVVMTNPGKLMYAAHNYGYIGPSATGAGGTVDGGNPTYASMDKATLYDNLNKGFGFVANPGKTYSAPVWVSEFGIGFNDSTSSADKAWFANLTQYLIDYDLDFAYWALNGTKTDSVEDYGLLTTDWSAPRTDWRTPYMNALINAPGKTGPITVTERFTAPDNGNGDENQSASLGDWASGANKATCPDGYHMAGVSRYDRSNSKGRYRILCTNQFFGSLWSAGDPTATQVVNESTWYRGYDWAGGYTKYECPQGYFASGTTKHWWGTSGVLCAKANRPLGNSCRTIWFDRGDNRTSLKGGDWATGAYKGQASDIEYIAGIAQYNGNAAAILACSSTSDLPPSPTLATALPTVAKGSNVVLSYATSAAKQSSKNWVGIYAPGQIPGQAGSIAWQYTPTATGDISFSTSGLNPGNYAAWFLYNDGYSALAAPVSFTVQ
ncbi:MAG TPA: cellulase family glycosylhydrolase [Fluviicoccus sp.]|nr:cellulase family glycosylhydrolase [Fluviicoccus sp.]